MRRLSLSALGWLAGAAALTGCSGTTETPPGDDNGITGTVIDVYNASSGEVTRPAGDEWASIAALVEENGAYKRFPGTISDDGKLSIPDVPEGPYLLELVSKPSALYPSLPAHKGYHAMTARALDLGSTYSGRPQVTEMTKPTFLEIDATLGTPWQTYTDDGMGNVQPLDDDLQFVSKNAGVLGSWGTQASTAEDSPPPNGATALTGWKIDAQQAFQILGKLSLIDAGEGDDFTILHDVQETVGTYDDKDPWAGHTALSTKEAFVPAAFTMKDGGTAKLSGSFVPAKQKSFAFDFQGSAFNALTKDIPITNIYTDISVSMEAGTPNPQYGAFATLLDAYTFGITTFTDPDCGGDQCDPTICLQGCDLGTYVLPGDYKHTYTYGNPFSYGQELANLYIQFRVNVNELSQDMTTESLRGGFIVSAPVSEMNGKQQKPTLGLPQDIRVAGKQTPYDQVTTGVGATPEITWSAPALGKPTHYRVTVIDLTDTEAFQRRNIARFTVTDPKVRIADGILQTGHRYYFEVSAEVHDTRDPAAPFKKVPLRTATAYMFTGVVTP